MEQNSLEPNKRIAIPVDLIRTLAIGLVVLLHASNEALQASSVPMPYWWTALVYKSLALSCVPLFVMLSGALLLQPAKLNEPIRVFLKKRLKPHRVGVRVLEHGLPRMGLLRLPTYQLPLITLCRESVKELFTGAWYQFWFIYLIIGLYLITPILRVIIAHGNPRITRYLIALWFAGVAILPLNPTGIWLHFRRRRLCHRWLHRLLRDGQLPPENNIAKCHTVWIVNRKFCWHNLQRMAYDLSIKRLGAKQLFPGLLNRKCHRGVSGAFFDSPKG